MKLYTGIVTLLVLKQGSCQLQDDLSICYYKNKLVVGKDKPWALGSGSFLEIGAASCSAALSAARCAQTGSQKRWKEPEVKEGMIPKDGPPEKKVKEWLDKNPGYSDTDSACVWCQLGSQGVCMDCNSDAIEAMEFQGYVCAPHCATSLSSRLPKWRALVDPPPPYKKQTFHFLNAPHTWGTSQWCDALVAHVTEKDPQGTLFLKVKEKPVLDAPVEKFVKLCNELFDVDLPTWAKKGKSKEAYKQYEEQIKSGTNLLLKHSDKFENGKTHELFNLAKTDIAEFPYHICGEQCRRISKLYDQVSRTGTEVQTGKAQAANPWNLRRSPWSTSRYVDYKPTDKREMLDKAAPKLSNDELGAGADITHPVSDQNVEQRRVSYVLQAEDCVKCIDEDACYPQCFARGDCPFLLRHLTPEAQEEQELRTNDERPAYTGSPQLPLLP